MPKDNKVLTVKDRRRLAKNYLRAVGSVMRKAAKRAAKRVPAKTNDKLWEDALD